MWLSEQKLLPLKINCLVENLRLWYEPITHKTYNTPGVDIKVPGFGYTSSIEFLDRSKIMHYFYTIVQDLVSIGYSRGVSVRGAPYDFRKAPNELGDYFAQLKDLVEDTYRQNNNTKVVVIGHSMGSPVFLYFLNHQSQSWKDRFIQSYISLAGVWGGVIKAVRLMSSGFNLGILVIKPNIIREQQRTMTSTAFLMPSDQFWNSSEVLASTPEKNYTVANYKEFFQDLNFTQGYSMRKDTENLIRDLIPPEVPIHCIHGSQIPTEASLVYTDDMFPDKTPNKIYGDGDGTVNMRSLLGCTRWIGQQKQPVIHTVYKERESGHLRILVNPTVRKYILEVVTGKR
uniref:Group XV phospholipase A2 n=1 Tax=Arion vulgaris TaxID=1028688 RepID=A0A0B7ADR0_9EUPU